MQFQSTLPVWGATTLFPSSQTLLGFQSTLPVWGATLTVTAFTRYFPISIHAPRVGSDFTSMSCLHALHHFNPRSPCGERPCSSTKECSAWLFQSTLPVWGATKSGFLQARAKIFQSTLPVWGATGDTPVPIESALTISIHAPRVGSDEVKRARKILANLFQSTLPVWGATSSTKVLLSSGG